MIDRRALGVLLLVLGSTGVVALAGCGGRSRDDDAGASRAGAGGSLASGGKLGTSGDGGVSGGGSKSDGAGTSGSGGAAAVGGAGGAVGGGAGAEPTGESGAAAGGAGQACVDVCAREGDACCFEGAECVSPRGSCTIDVLKATVPILKDYASLEPRVSELDGELLVSLRDADVVAAAIEEPLAKRLELELSAQASSAAQALLEAHLNAVRVSCDGQPLFVGVVYPELGAAAIETPVLHVSERASGDDDARLVLRLGAWEGAWMGLDVHGGGEEFKARLDRPELRAALCRRGVLSALD